MPEARSPVLLSSAVVRFVCIVLRLVSVYTAQIRPPLNRIINIEVVRFRSLRELAADATSRRAARTCEVAVHRAFNVLTVAKLYCLQLFELAASSASCIGSHY